MKVYAKAILLEEYFELKKIDGKYYWFYLPDKKAGFATFEIPLGANYYQLNGSGRYDHFPFRFYHKNFYLTALIELFILITLLPIIMLAFWAAIIKKINYGLLYLHKMFKKIVRSPRR